MTSPKPLQIPLRIKFQCMNLGSEYTDIQSIATLLGSSTYLSLEYKYDRNFVRGKSYTCTDCPEYPESSHCCGRRLPSWVLRYSCQFSITYKTFEFSSSQQWVGNNSRINRYRGPRSLGTNSMRA